MVVTLLSVAGLIPVAIAQEPKADPRERPLFWNPAEGTAHPVFATAGKDDAIDIFLSFGPAHQRMRSLGEQLTEPQVRWRRRIMIDTGVKVPIERRISGNSLNIVVHGMDDPMPVVDKLIEMYRKSKLPLSEIFMTRRTMEQGVPGDPVADPRMAEAAIYSDPDAFWAAVFDLDGPPPVSEDPKGMLSVLTFRDGKILNETRGMPLHLEGVRIAYGRPGFETLPPDARSAEVARLLRRKLDTAFPRSAAPPFFDGERKMQRVSKVQRGDRIGYSFAIERYTKEIGPFVVRYPGTFRYREYELLRGVQGAIRRLNLEPVIIWHRGDVYAVSVWEKSETSADSAAKPAVDPGTP